MYLSKTLLFVALSAVVLAGCETEPDTPKWVFVDPVPSSNGGQTPSSPTAEQTAFVDDLNNFGAPYNAFLAEGPTISSNMPSSGTATFTGFVEVQQGSTGAIARANLNAYFGTGALTMTTSDYYVLELGTEVSRPSAGTLAIRDGRIGNTTASSITGTVTGYAGGRKLNTTVSGGFIGNGADAIFLEDSTSDMKIRAIR